MGGAVSGKEDGTVERGSSAAWLCGGDVSRPVLVVWSLSSFSRCSLVLDVRGDAARIARI